MRVTSGAHAGFVAVALAGVACHEGAVVDDGARSPVTSPRPIATVASPPTSGSVVAKPTASSSPPPSTWTAAAKQPTTEDELHAFTGQWHVTGSSLKLRAHRDGIALMFEVEADTADYRKGDLRFELEMALNGTGFSVRDHGRIDPGGKTYANEALAECLQTTRIVGEPTYGSYDYLHAKVVDADTLRVQRVVWSATFVTGSDGRIVHCVDAHQTDERWDELRRVK